jgi:23S rRNA (pseudouridine1915-N3)-methyltransferase
LKIQLLAIGKGMPAWVEAGYQEYAKRLPSDYRLELIEVPAIRRGNQVDTSKITRQETQSLLEKTPKGSHIIALERRGKALSSLDFAKKLGSLHDQSQNLSLWIGGPEGLDLELIESFEQWSLSGLTMPHPLVRVVLAEQIYRAVCILQNHPYHR